MLSLVFYEDGKKIFEYGSSVLPEIGETVVFKGISYKVLNRKHIVSEDLYKDDIHSKNMLTKVKLNVVEIED